jgi:hypothetical protein
MLETVREENTIKNNFRGEREVQPKLHLIKTYGKFHAFLTWYEMEVSDELHAWRNSRRHPFDRRLRSGVSGRAA